MLNDNAKKWVEALKSGEYKQTQGQLKYQDAYCCLGVLCQLYMDETGKGKWNSNATVPVGLERSTGYFPDEVAYWAGLKDTSGCVEGLVTANDEGRDFKKIAKMIEAEPEGLFS